MADPNKPDPRRDPTQQAIISIEPGTLVAIIGLLILLPLVITGFVSQ